MALSVDQVFRDFNSPNVPSSGEFEPVKAEIRALLKQIQNSGAMSVARNTLAALNAVTPPNENYMGIVLNDPNPANNGYYSRSGSAWVFGRGFPDTFAEIIISGTGSARTGSISVGVNPSDIEVFFANAGTPNTGPITLAIAGGIPRPVVNIAGNPLSAGEWTGIVMFYLNPSNQYQLLIDAGAAASAAASATAASAAAGLAADYAAAAGSASGQLIRPTVASLLSDTVFSYTPGTDLVVVSAGVTISAQTFRYVVAASGASDHHLVTAGGVKLYARPDTENRISTAQFGIPNGVESAPVQAAFLALVRACREQVAVVFQPENSDIWLNATADVRNVHIDMRGRLFRNHATQPVIISGGNSNVRNNPPQKFWEVANLGGADNPAIIVKGMKGSVMDLQRCNSVLLYADTTLALAGADDSIAYSVFNFYDVTQIELGNNPTTDGSAIQWINENRFNLKRTGRIYIGRNSTYRHNHNTFVNGNVEGETAAIIIVDMGQDNQFTDLRFEGTPVITLTPNSRSTTIEYSWNDNSDLLRDPSRLWRNALINDQGTGNRVIYMPWKTDTRSVVFSFNARQHRTFSLGLTAYGGGCEHKMITAYPVGFETVARGSGSTVLDWTSLIPFPLNSRFVMGCDAATVRPNVRFYNANRQLITVEPTLFLPSQAVQWNTDHIRPTSTNLSNFGIQNQDPNIAFISIRIQGGSAVLPFSVLYCHLWNRAPDTLDIISRYQIDRIGEASRPNAGVPTRGVPYVGQVVRAPDGTTNRCGYQMSTETTAATSTTATTISVPTGHGATAGNNIAIELTDGSVHWTTVTSAATNVITIPALPGVAAPLGANVQIWSWT